jgi:hypothetical protein
MKFEQPPQEPKEKSVLEARPGQMVFMYKSEPTDPESLTLYAEVRQTPEGEFAVVKGRSSGLETPAGKSFSEHAQEQRNHLEAQIAGSPKFKSLEEANQELMRIADLNGWEWGSANDYDGFEKQWKAQKESEQGE